MPHDQAEPHFTYELGEREGHPVINDDEAASFVAYHTGLTVEKVREVLATDLEYLKRCGLAVEE